MGHTKVLSLATVALVIGREHARRQKRLVQALAGQRHSGLGPHNSGQTKPRKGVVTLFGIVPSPEAKTAAAADARKVSGVKRVEKGARRGAGARGGKGPSIPLSSRTSPWR